MYAGMPKINTIAHVHIYVSFIFTFIHTLCLLWLFAEEVTHFFLRYSININMTISFSAHNYHHACFQVLMVCGIATFELKTNMNHFICLLSACQPSQMHLLIFKINQLLFIASILLSRRDRLIEFLLDPRYATHVKRLIVHITGMWRSSI